MVFWRAVLQASCTPQKKKKYDGTLSVTRWSPQSLDLAIIKAVWDHLDREWKTKGSRRPKKCFGSLENSSWRLCKENDKKSLILRPNRNVLIWLIFVHEGRSKCRWWLVWICTTSPLCTLHHVFWLYLPVIWMTRLPHNSSSRTSSFGVQLRYSVVQFSTQPRTDRL